MPTLLLVIAALPRDTVFLAERAAPSHLVNNWALSALGVIGIGLASWALGRSVNHGEQIRELVVFTGADGRNGLAENVRAMRDTLAELVEIGHANRSDLEMLKERSLHTREK